MFSYFQVIIGLEYKRMVYNIMRARWLNFKDLKFINNRCIIQTNILIGGKI